MGNQDVPISAQAPYYEGLGFPLDRLHASDFEKFVFGCLLCIQDVLGLQITGKPSGPGDGGFDVQGEVVATGRLVCVQCKRQGQPLDLAQLAEELAKVAATAALENSDIGEHRFICTGGIRMTVINALRRAPRDQLATEVGNRLLNATEGELSKLRQRLEEHGNSPYIVGESYVLGLDLLTAWNSQEFDAALSPRWDEVLQVAQRYFRIATVVRDQPRINFNRSTYIDEYSHFKTVVEPRITNTDLPAGITIASMADTSSVREVTQKNIKSLTDLLQLEAGDLALLLGQGGAGKSTTLALVRAHALEMKPESALPVLISLSTYMPGALDRLIHQELGADHGTWRSLPDDVLLLCDGLNECPLVNVVAFLDEIRPLLKRKRIACILSTRESTRLTNIILPQPPLMCAKVRGITPIAIRRIAESKLNPVAADAFVQTYTSLAESSRSPLLWTPFAVLVALGVWRLRSAVPTTLGEMIETLLQSRSARNAELPQQEIHPTVILKLASALAFQCLFMDKRLECPPQDAGKWIREAKMRCNDALGIADIGDTEMVKLLTSHELLCASENGYVGFGHQLLAGSLAAGILAQVWVEHLGSLGESVADDAWVFAARLVARDHMADFLKAVLNVDLMLGARAAKELPGDIQEIAEELLSRSIAPEVPEAIRHQGLFALARLGTPGAILRLREAVKNHGSSTHYSALRALASTGDSIYLRPLLLEIDKLKSVPMKISGGEVDVWEAAPFSVRLSLARERLSQCTAGEPVGESLLLVAYERDPDDAAMIERHLHAALDITAFQRGLYALHATAPLRAKEIFDETLSGIVEPHSQARVLRIAAGIGVEIDMRAAFECALSDVTHIPPEDHPEFDLQQLISDVLEKAEIPKTITSIVERDLPRDMSSRSTRLWQLAYLCKSTLISQYALSCIEKWTAERGNACSYFIRQIDSARAQKQTLLRLCEKGLSDEQTWYDWNTSRVLALVGSLGFTAEAAKSLAAMLQRLARVRHAVEINDSSHLSSLDLKILDSVKPNLLAIHLGGIAAQLIPAVAQASPFLSHDDLLLLLPFRMHGYDGVVDHQREILANIDDVLIDKTLNNIVDDWARLSGLLVVSNRHPTKARIELLRIGLQTFYTHPAALNIVCRAVENSWCKETFDMVVKTVADIPKWSEQDSQFFWDFCRMVAKHLDSGDVQALDVAIPAARTDFAQRILGIWRDHASGERIGLTKLHVWRGLAYGVENNGYQ